MRKRIQRGYIFIILGFIGVVVSIALSLHLTLAQRNTLDYDPINTAINNGKTQLFQKTVPGALQAYSTFQSVNSASYNSANDQQKIKIRAYLAVTRMLDLMLRDDSNGQIDTLTKLFRQYGILPEGTTFDAFTFQMPLNDDEKIILPASAPSGEAIRSFLAGPFMTAINASISDLDAAIALCPATEGIDKEIISKTLLDPDNPPQKDIEVDAGDYYLFRAMLKAFKAYALTISAYDLNVSIREIVAMANMDIGNMKLLFDRNANLLKLLPTGSTPGYNGAAKLVEAKTALKEAIDDYLTASDKIRNDTSTTLGAEELITLKSEDLNEETKFRSNMTALRNSLVNNNTADLTSGSSDHINLNLNPLFAGNLNLRDLLPQFSGYSSGGQFVSGTVGHGLGDDATLGGILPAYTQDTWSRSADSLQPSGLVTVPTISTGAISVQDGSVSDWNSISPIFTDVIGDALGNNSLDISKVYLAKDANYLYVRMDMAGTIPQSSGMPLTYILNLKKSSGGDIAGDVQINVSYNPWPTPAWQAWILKTDLYGNYPGTQLNSSSFKVFGNTIEIAAPLSLVGEISGRFIAVTSSRNWGWETVDNNYTNLQISPTATLTGTLTVPQYNGTGLIYIGVFQYNGGFNVNSDNRIGGLVIYPDQYSAGMTYTINNLPVSAAGEKVFVTVLWDRDGNGIISPGDYTNYYLPAALVANSNTKNLATADDHPAYEAPQLTNTYIFSRKLPVGQDVILMTFPKGPSPDDVTVTVKGQGLEFALQPTIFAHQAGWGLAYSYIFNWLPDGDYIFEAVDSLGRKASATYHYQYNGNIPALNAASFLPVNNSYMGTTTPTLSWTAPDGGTHFYKVYIQDSTGKAYWYMSPILSTTSVTVPSGILQPNTQYQWFVRVFDNGTAPMNSSQSQSLSFYTGSYIPSPTFSFTQLVSEPPTGAITTYTNFANAKLPGVAPWDITSYTLKDANGTVNSGYYTDPRFYTNAFFMGKYSTNQQLTTGNYTIEVKANRNGQTATLTSSSIPYQFNSVQAVDITTLIPSNNYYFNTLTPTFSWASVANSNTYYLMRIYDPLNKIMIWQSDFSQNTSVTVPEGVLMPGGTYYWTVMTSSDYNSSNGRLNSINFVNTEGNNGNMALLRFTIVTPKGDINSNGVVDLADAILSLQVISGLNPSTIRADYATAYVDVNGDNKVGLAEIIFILQKIAQLR